MTVTSRIGHDYYSPKDCALTRQLETMKATLLLFVAMLGSLTAETPNIVFVLADDLGYGDIGCFGQTKIKTPHLDQMAKEGLKLTNFYAGSTVCAPSRCVLMTGKHTGRARVRGNGWGPLEDDDVTVAEVLKQAGYRTALCGKWGIGEEGTTGVPNKQGFDFFYGYLNQRHAHNYYPTFLLRNDQRESLPNVPESEDKVGGGWAREAIAYSHDLILEESLNWIEKESTKPFFLYLALTIPHANNERGRGLGDGQEVPDYGIYEDKDWTRPNKGQAAMVSHMDRDMGRLFAKLKDLSIDENTLVIFTSDNGHHREGGNDPDFFDANGPLRGMKRDLYEGGIRVPTIARWPGMIAADKTSTLPAYFGDFMSTVCELTAQKLPDETQSVSFLPTLLGKLDAQVPHNYLYWEFHEGEGKQAVRFGKWKAVRQPFGNGHIELYDLSKDIGERKNCAIQRNDLVQRAAQLMNDAHVPDPRMNTKKRKQKKTS